MHDDKGSFGITGHSAIVMDHYYSNMYKEYYVRVCEAVSAGVTYGILSDDRVVNIGDKGGWCYYIMPRELNDSARTVKTFQSICLIF